MLELKNDISKLIDNWYKIKTEGYNFRDDDTYDAVMNLVEDLKDAVDELISDTERHVDYELENAELKAGYWVERPTIDDCERFRYENMM